MDVKVNKRKETLFFTGRNVLVLYLLLAAPLLDPILPCHARRLINNSMYLRHFLGFLTLTFFIVIIDEYTDTIKSVSYILGICIGIYIWFLLSSRMTGSTWIALIMTFAALYGIDLITSKIENPSTETETLITQVNMGLIVFAVGLTLVGFIAYMGEKKLEYGRSFDYVTFLLGTESCKGTLSHTPFLKAVGAAFT